MDAPARQVNATHVRSPSIQAEKFILSPLKGKERPGNQPALPDVFNCLPDRP